MKKDDIDIELLLNIIFNTPDGFDINSIEFINGSIRVNTSFDYLAVQKQMRDTQSQQFSEEYQEWAKRFEDYQNKVEQGIIKPDKRIGWERQLAACYDKQLALEVAKEIEELNKPKKRGRPRKDKTALPSAV